MFALPAGIKLNIAKSLPHAGLYVLHAYFMIMHLNILTYVYTSMVYILAYSNKIKLKLLYFATHQDSW